MSERRYSDDEAAAIFLKAAEGAESPAPHRARETGMSLAELQAVGVEAGIPANAVADAARSLTTSSPGSGPTLLGIPIGVERTTELPRRLTDAEWEQLVVDLRDTFHARGTVREHGSFREWTNGNLQALLEPTPEGNRLRLRTNKGNTRTLIATGLGTLGVTATMVMTGIAAGDLVRSLSPIVLVGALGVGMLGYALVPLRGWARLRARQMEDIIARVSQVTAVSLPAEHDRTG